MDLATMRARVRQDLQDTDATNYRWTDAEIDAAIERVVREFSLAYPLEQQTTIATTDDSEEISLSTFSGLLSVVQVEFPTDLHPPYLQHFEVWNNTIFMQDKGDGGDARVRWHKKHTLDATSSTIPAQFEEIIVLGATGYLATSASVYTVDRATIAGGQATINFLKWGQARLDLYQKRLKAISRNNRAIPRELYTD